MKTPTVPFIVSLILAWTTTSSLALNLRARLRQYKQIHVLNELTTDKVLHIHCHSRETDMGTNDVAVGSEYTWRFRPGPIGRPRWTCDATTDDKRSVTFDSYWEDVAQPRREYMGNTYWVAQEEGIYLRPIQGTRDQIHATWVSIVTPAPPKAPQHTDIN
ncbi:S-protein homolog 74 [Linum perenne]